MTPRSVKRSRAFAAAAAGVLAASSIAAEARAASPPFNLTNRFDAHNSFWMERSSYIEARAGGPNQWILDMIYLDRVRDVEIDLHTSERDGRKTWAVYHTSDEFWNNAQCKFLEDCLLLLRNYHQQNPDHEVFVVNLESKNTGMNSCHDYNIFEDYCGDSRLSPETLDGLVRAYLPVFGPREHQKWCLGKQPNATLSTMNDVTRQCGWPDLDTLRGKFVLTLHGGFDVAGDSNRAAVDWYAWHGRYGGTFAKGIASTVFSRAAYPMHSGGQTAAYGTDNEVFWDSPPMSGLPLDKLDAANNILRSDDWADTIVESMEGLVGWKSFESGDKFPGSKHGFHLVQTDDPQLTFVSRDDWTWDTKGDVWAPPAAVSSHSPPHEKAPMSWGTACLKRRDPSGSTKNVEGCSDADIKEIGYGLDVVLTTRDANRGAADSLPGLQYYEIQGVDAPGARLQAFVSTRAHRGYVSYNHGTGNVQIKRSGESHLGCLMARGSATDKDAPFVALCRKGWDVQPWSPSQGLFAYRRPSRGAPIQVTSFSQPYPAYLLENDLQLDVSPDGTCALLSTASAYSLGKLCLTGGATFSSVGLAVQGEPNASRPTTVEWLFANPRANLATVRARHLALHSLVDTWKVDAPVLRDDTRVSDEPLPPAPALSACPSGPTSVKLQWPAYKAQGYRIDSLRLEQKRAADSQWQLVRRVPPASGLGYTATGLRSGETYDYRLVVEREKDVSSSTARVSTSVASVPTNLRAERTGPTTVDLRWDYSGPAAEFKISSRVHPAGTWEQIAVLDGKQRQLTHTGVGQLTGTVYYMINALTNASCQGASAEVAAGLTPPAKVDAKVVGHTNAVAITFVDSSYGEQTFDILRRTGSQDFVKVGSVTGERGTGASLSYTDYVPTASTSYTYAVAASDYWYNSYRSPIQPTVALGTFDTVLAVGNVYDISSTTVGEEKLFVFSAPEDNLQRLTFQIENPATATGDADLYVRFGEPPTTSAYDCRSATSNLFEICDSETGHFPIRAGRWYVLVRTSTPYSKLRVRALLNALHPSNSHGIPDWSRPFDGARGSQTIFSLARCGQEMGQWVLLMPDDLHVGGGNPDLYIQCGTPPSLDANGNVVNASYTSTLKEGFADWVRVGDFAQDYCFALVKGTTAFTGYKLRTACGHTAPGCSVESAEGFPGGMFGCPGSVSFAERENQCLRGFHACSAKDWVHARGGNAPGHDYWVDDELLFSGTAGSCAAKASGGSSCGAAPMRVCGAAKDAEGNECATLGCGLDTASPDERFGGCGTSQRAGTLCCPGADLVLQINADRSVHLSWGHSRVGSTTLNRRPRGAKAWTQVSVLGANVTDFTDTFPQASPGAYEYQAIIANLYSDPVESNVAIAQP
jgi:hypothetical protein